MSKMKYNPLTGQMDLVSEFMCNVTFAELVDLRTFGRLIPGMKYRIIDYCTTAIDSGVKSDNPNVKLMVDETLFDVIVTATSNNKLSENAEACCKEGKMPKSRYESWQLKYSINSRGFAWAGENFTGIIYYMKDEFGNTCPYDFKTIKFLFLDDNSQYYTFSKFDNTGNTIDATTIFLPGVNISNIRGNVIEECCINNICYIPSNILCDDSGSPAGVFMSYNKIGANCYDNNILTGCCYNTILGNTNNKTLMSGSHGNIIFPNAKAFLQGVNQIFKGE